MRYWQLISFTIFKLKCPLLYKFKQRDAKIIKLQLNICILKINCIMDQTRSSIIRLRHSMEICLFRYCIYLHCLYLLADLLCNDLKNFILTITAQSIRSIVSNLRFKSRITRKRLMLKLSFDWFLRFLDLFRNISHHLLKNGICKV